MLLLLGCSDYEVVDKKDEIPFDSATEAQDTVTVDTGTEDTDPGETATVETAPQDTDTAPIDTGEPEECRRILVYSTEGRSDRDNYLGFFDALPVEPALAAYEVVVMERAYDGPLTEAMLDGFTQLWMLGVDRDTTSTPLPDEVAAVEAFVAAGHGLLLAAEHESSSYSYVEDVNEVAALYGLTFGGSRNEGTDGTARSVEDATGPLMTGVTSVTIFSSTAYLTPTDAAVQTAFTFDGEPSVAWRDDGVRVVFDRSWGGYRDLHITVGDQAVFVGNVADFLETCP